MGKGETGDSKIHRPWGRLHRLQRHVVVVVVLLSVAWLLSVPRISTTSMADLNCITFRYYSWRAEKGDVKAIHRLIGYYVFGPNKDRDRVRYWLLKLIESGESVDPYLRKLYLEGTDSVPNDTKLRKF